MKDFERTYSDMVGSFLEGVQSQYPFWQLLKVTHCLRVGQIQGQIPTQDTHPVYRGIVGSILDSMLV